MIKTLLLGYLICNVNGTYFLSYDAAHDRAHNLGQTQSVAFTCLSPRRGWEGLYFVFADPEKDR